MELQIVVPASLSEAAGQVSRVLATLPGDGFVAKFDEALRLTSLPAGHPDCPQPARRAELKALTFAARYGARGGATR